MPKIIRAWLYEISCVSWPQHYLMETLGEFPVGCVWLPLITVKQACQTGGPWDASGPFKYFSGPPTFKTYCKYRQTLQFIIN